MDHTPADGPSEPTLPADVDPSAPPDAVPPVDGLDPGATPLWRRTDQWVLAGCAALAVAWLATDWALSTRWGLNALDVQRDPARRLDYRIDINRADRVRWQNLPGVGEVLARRIVAHRAEHGPFRSIDDLQAVRGVGPKLTERLRPYLYVTQGTPDADRARP